MTATFLADRSRGLAGRTVLWLGATAIAVMLAAVVQFHFGLNPDTSWLLSVADRMIDGAVPYRDILETNPPASFLIDVPAVLVGRALGVDCEVTTLLLLFAGAGLSLALSGCVLHQAGLLKPRDRPALLLIGTVALVLLPMGSFGQREHVAVMSMLPLLAALCARSEGREFGLGLAFLAGLGGGMAVAIKPIFVLALLGPLACAFAGTSKHKVWSWVEFWGAGLVTLGYAGSVAVFFPDYASRVLPLVTMVYLPARLDILSLLTLGILLAWGLITIVVLRNGGWTDPLGRVLILASAGFAASVVVQGKGFTYHGYPALALGVLACALTAASGRPTLTGTLTTAMATLAAIAVLADQRAPAVEAPGLAGAVAALSPHPKLLTIGNNIRYATAFAHSVGGTWVGSTPTTWVTNSAYVITPEAGLVSPYLEAIAAERDRFAADILRSRPDAILFEGFAWQNWALNGPALRQALKDYQVAGRFGPIILMTLHDASSGTAGGERS